MRAIFLFATLLVAGCATEMVYPVTGQMGDGTPAAGQATARLDGRGDFWVQEPGGPRCSGTYDSLDMSPTIIAPVSCTDGRHGEVVITRVRHTSGTAIVRLNDGSRGQFVFGDVSFDQAYGSGRASTPSNVRIVR